MPAGAEAVAETAPPEAVEAPARGGVSVGQSDPVSGSAGPAFTRLIVNSGIVRSQDSMESFLDKVVATPEWLRMLENNDDLARCTIDVFEHSQYFADQLVRNPGLLREVEQACGDKQGRTGFVAPDDPAELRRFFGEQMVRIQCDSVYHWCRCSGR